MLKRPEEHLSQGAADRSQKGPRAGVASEQPRVGGRGIALVSDRARVAAHAVGRHDGLAQRQLDLVVDAGDPTEEERFSLGAPRIRIRQRGLGGAGRREGNVLVAVDPDAPAGEAVVEREVQKAELPQSRGMGIKGRAPPRVDGGAASR